MAFSASSFTQSLALPLQQAAGTAAADTVKNLFSGAQKITDFATPGGATKQAEALLKMGTQGISDKFNSLSSKLGIKKSNGDINVVDKTTNKKVAKVGEYATSGVPAEVGDAPLEDNTNMFKVKIRQSPGLGSPGDLVVFDVMPTISEQRSVSYDPVSPLHHPGDILKYKSTSSRSWTVRAKLVARNVEEASRNLNIVNVVRGWAMPFYGQGTADTLKTLLGAPPPILTLEAYGSTVIGPVKCVMESYDLQWPNDVDYIPTYDRVPFPTVIEISINLKESWSPAEYSGFDMIKYRNGILPEAFTAVIDRTPPEKTPEAAAKKPPSGVDTSQKQSVTNASAANKASTVPNKSPAVTKPLSAIKNAAATAAKATAPEPTSYNAMGDFPTAY